MRRVAQVQVRRLNPRECLLRQVLLEHFVIVGAEDGHLGTCKQRQTKAIRMATWGHGRRRVISSHQQSSAIISDHQQSSEAIRGNQRQSEAITFAVTDLGSTVDTMRQKKGRKLGALRMTAFRKDDG